ncbi:MAG: M1 family aminopeptidase [Kiritimatiellia bacterium]
MDWKFKRADFRRPPAQLEHVDVSLAFFADRVEGRGVLHCRAREEMKEILLDCEGRKVAYPLDRVYRPGEAFTVEVAHTCHPDDTRLEGIYKDVTPKGCPQQFMSQCQQYGFQRILPIIDDCTAKCTFRTTLEGDARYTHLISNGDLVSRTVADGRQRWVYENRRPMAPYLFLACAGTWEVLADSVTYPDGGKTVRLEYLVPPGHVDGARVPMDILKRAILFQHRLTGFVYPFETYRTICMEKSLYGGMENTGNTTIVTEAALIDETIPDGRLVYAHGVIPHEYEHNHCGSGVTMESVFDMWLNEAYTVNVERACLAQTFGAAFARQLEIDALRGRGGALAEEEGGVAAPVVREGVNDPDEVVDAITYDKAPEVLNTLRNLIGASAYDAAWKEYFRRFDGGNATTDDFLKVFSDVTGRDVAALLRPWLFEAGHPTVTAGWTWKDGRLTVSLARDRPYVVPVPFALVKDGKDVAAGTFILDGARQEFSTACPKPDFISWNRGCGFYGVLETSAGEAELARQVRTDPDMGARAEAMKTLRDRGATATWLDLYTEIFADRTLDPGAKAGLLSIPADSLDRRRRAFVQENVREMHALRQAAARRIGPATLIAELAGAATGGTDAAAIVRRAYENCVLQLLAELDESGAWTALKGYLDRAVNITARLNALRAILASPHPARHDIVAAAGRGLRKSLNGYTGYLGVVASDPRESVFAALAAEERRAGWSIRHPALSRALYCGFADNGDRLWTPRGLAWMERTIVAYARVGEYNALRLLAPFALWKRFPPALRADVEGLLDRVSAALPRHAFPFIGGRLAALR